MEQSTFENYTAIKEFSEEEERMKLRLLQADAGLIGSKDLLVTAERMDWMYHNPVQSKQAQEDYLLGKPLEEVDDKQSRKHSFLGSLTSGSLFLPSITAQNDHTLRRLTEDPLLVIKQAEYRQRLMNSTREKLLGLVAQPYGDKNVEKQLQPKNKKKHTVEKYSPSQEERRSADAEHFNTSRLVFENNLKNSGGPSQGTTTFHRSSVASRHSMKSPRGNEVRRRRYSKRERTSRLSTSRKQRESRSSHSSESLPSAARHRASTSFNRSSSLHAYDKKTRRSHHVPERSFSRSNHSKRHSGNYALRSNENSTQLTQNLSSGRIRDAFESHITSKPSYCGYLRNSSRDHSRRSISKRESVHPTFTRRRHRCRSMSDDTFSRSPRGRSYINSRPRAWHQTVDQVHTKNHSSCHPREQRKDGQGEKVVAPSRYNRRQDKCNGNSPSGLNHSRSHMIEKRRVKGSEHSVSTESFRNHSPKTKYYQSSRGIDTLSSDSKASQKEKKKHLVHQEGHNNEKCQEVKNKSSGYSLDTLKSTHTEKLDDHSSPYEKKAPIQGPVCPLEWKAQLENLRNNNRPNETDQIAVDEGSNKSSENDSDDDSDDDLGPPSSLIESITKFREKKIAQTGARLPHKNQFLHTLNIKKNQNVSPDTEVVSEHKNYHDDEDLKLKEVERMMKEGYRHEYEKQKKLEAIEAMDAIREKQDDSHRIQSWISETQQPFQQSLLKQVCLTESSSLEQRLIRYAARRQKTILNLGELNDEVK